MTPIGKWFAPHAAFAAAFPTDGEFDHPPGCYLVRQLHEGLLPLAARVDEFDNWRDVGWVVTCLWQDAGFEVYFAPHGESAPPGWILGIAPLGQPGVIRRLFGAKPVPYIDDSRELTAAVHALLEADPHVSRIRWAMNDDPRNGELEHPNGLIWPEVT